MHQIRRWMEKTHMIISIGEERDLTELKIHHDL
jgi:hypothetical protein